MIHISGHRLLALWKAIDANENGFITAGEFGKFMRAAFPADERAHFADEHKEERVALRDAARLQQAQSYTRIAANAALMQAQAMEAEAERLEANLKKLVNDNASTARERPELPLSKYETRRLHAASAASSPGKGSGTRSRPVRKVRSEPKLRPQQPPTVSTRLAVDDADDGARLVAEALHELAREVGTLGRKAASSTMRVAAHGHSTYGSPYERALPHLNDRERGVRGGLPPLRRSDIREAM